MATAANRCAPQSRGRGQRGGMYCVRRCLLRIPTGNMGECQPITLSEPPRGGTFRKSPAHQTTPEIVPAWPSTWLNVGGSTAYAQDKFMSLRKPPTRRATKLTKANQGFLFEPFHAGNKNAAGDTKESRPGPPKIAFIDFDHIRPNPPFRGETRNPA
jgi:hypothetical protein